MNEPLTLEQLKSDLDVPVYVKPIGRTNISHEGWGTLDFCCFDPDFVTIWWPGSDVQDFGFIDDYGKTWLAYAYPFAHIDREAWEHCDECKPSCKICANYNAWDRYGKPQVCDTCEDYSNFEPDDKYCSNCGRPLTEEAWKELEKRVRGEK